MIPVNPEAIGLFGLFANVAVIINVMFTFAILSAFGATLTAFPGLVPWRS